MEDNINTGGISIDVPGYDKFVKLGESHPYVTVKATNVSDGSLAVIKTLSSKFPSKEDIAKLEREARLLKKLASPRVVKVIDVHDSSKHKLALIKEPFGIPLDEFLDSFENRQVPVDQLFDIAIQLAEILEHVHHNRVIHKDIKPKNILIDPNTREVKITDFSSASELSKEYKEVNMSSRIEGTLAYISPEQTGRMNRDIDYRSDYYSLGITLYEMATGQLPFTSTDALEMVHFHISKTAPLASTVNGAIPVVVAQVIAKLTAKNAEDRYQSIFGMKHDLLRCKELYLEGKLDDTFDLGAKDISEQFTISQRLYGRESELERLEQYFEKAADGTVTFCLVSGYSGVGKSVLVYELARSIASKKGFLISGKFDQYRQNTSYSALAQAFKELIKQLIREPEEQIQQWRVKILDAVGSNGQIMVDLIPELELIIGEQPHLQELSPAESQNRFLLTFTSFVRVFASKEHPLVLFLDDLQWSDIPSLSVINRLVTSPLLSHLLIIGTYRDNEVDAKHPLMLRIREIQQRRVIERIDLAPLKIDAIKSLTADTLSTTVDAVEELSRVLYAKTHGNPFFTIQLLQNLYDNGVIYFNETKGCWDWTIEEVHKMHYSDNVIDVLVESHKGLDTSSQNVLQLASCIGASFDLKTLSVIFEQPASHTVSALNEPMQLNMIVPLDNAHQYEDLQEEEWIEVNPTYRFQHDRIQEAAYFMIPEGKKEQLHLSIGRLILHHINQDELDDRIIDIVSHLDAGKTLLNNPNERIAFAELSLKAGIIAKQSAAYESALDYLDSGFNMLGETAWEEEYKLTWLLAEELQHCHYLTGDWDFADRWTQTMLDNARTDLQKGRVLATRTRQYATIGKMKESIDAAYEGFKILGFNLIDDPTTADVEKEIERVKQNLEGRKISELIHMPPIEDPRAIIASQLYMEIFAAAFLSGSGEKFPYLVLNSVNLALEYGSGPESAFAYAAYGMLLCGFQKQPELGNEFGKLGIEMIEMFDGINLKSRIYYVYTMFVSHWSNHWSSMTPLFRQGIETGYQSGDLLYLAYSAQDCIIWDPTIDLEKSSSEHKKLLEIVKECDYQDSYDSGTLFLQMQLNFLDRTKSLYSLTDDSFDEEECVLGMKSRHFMTGLANYNIYKAEIHLMYNDHLGALPFVVQQEQLRASVMSLPQQARFCIVSFLVYSMNLREQSQDNSELYHSRMSENLKTMRLWAETCEDNFLHLVHFMEAELLVNKGNLFEALPLYDKAVAIAHKYGWQRDEGMINEFAGRALMENNLTKASEGYLHAAYYNYYQWGATRKIKHLIKSYPEIFASNAIARSSANTALLDLGGTTSSSFSSDLLDISSLFRASQTISRELVLDNLLRETLKILIENAGAQSGLIIEKVEEDLVVRSSIMDGEMVASIDTDFPATLLNVCLRTDQTIVIDDASKPNDFSTDPYILRKQPKSIMCVPLPKHGVMRTAVYLENNLTRSAFTNERVEVIKLLAGQSSVSLENARIYNEQEQLMIAQQRFIPKQFLEHLGRRDIGKVLLGDSVAMNMSVLFSDLRKFTPLVESNPPKTVIQLLNSYYEAVGKPIDEYEGFIGSYSGDEIMALFAVPPVNAVRAGIKMSEALWEFNAQSGKLNRPELRMGIGLNSGPLVLGTMGGGERIQCAVLGDTVNLASRIEQLTKSYQSQFLIGEKTYDSIKDNAEFSLRMVDYVAVKGKDHAVKIYEVLNAEEDEIRRQKEESISLLQNGMNAYFGRDFDTALKHFDEGVKMYPHDLVFEIFMERSRDYLTNPPDDTWQGFTKLHNK